jgi:superfamily I DNA/RNA helicase
MSQIPPPTDQQRKAIFDEELEYLLRAAPGSGKTWTACRRFIWRAANWPYEVGGIALLSFTNVAIREFHEAASKFGQARLLQDPNYLGTFDAFVERFILGPFGHLLVGAKKRPVLYRSVRPGDRKNSKLQCWASIGGKTVPVYAWDIVPSIKSDKLLFKTSSDYGGKQLDTANASAAVIELLRLGFYTHAQRAYLANRLLKQRPHIAARLAMRFPEVIIDEAQDTNVWLLRLLEKLREQGTRVTLVGDPDQCIYSFAMADAASLFALRDKWQIPENPLDKSFRCNDQIAFAVKNMGSNVGLPPVSLNGDVWIATMKERMAALIAALGALPVPTLGNKIQKRGLEQKQFALPLFEEQKLFPSIRHDTIHQVKGESIDAVLVIGSSKFWNSVVTSVATGVNNEDRRLAYVAMTRAKHLLVLSLPSSHYDKCIKHWYEWGFATAES